MKTFIFLGPTLRLAEARTYLKDATYLPPVSQGDVAALLSLKPDVIGIIDGYFERVPAVWHKEILFALARGVRVLGAASMGALRAAELDACGMEGVGTVYKWYKEGVLEADDEVAVRHAPRSGGYRVFSEALVNIRRTLSDAAARGVVAERTARDLVRLGRELFYADRSYARLLKEFAARGGGPAEIGRLEEFLKHHRVDQKKLDAIALLKQVRGSGRSARSRPVVPAAVPHTHFWERLLLDKPLVPGEDAAVSEERLLNYARFHDPRFAGWRDRALLRALAVQWARAQGFAAGARDLAEERARLRRRLGLPTESAWRRWREKNRLSEADLRRMLEEETLARKVLSALLHSNSVQFRRALLDQLRLENAYGPLASKAAARERRLERHADIDALTRRLSAEGGRVLIESLVPRVGTPSAENVREFARSLGMDDADFVREALRETAVKKVLRERRPR